MRKIILDTETTGLDPNSGDRVIEIGCVELLGRRLSGQHFHVYLNPGRPVGDSQRVHGLSDDFLADKPVFESVAAEFIEYIRGAELVIHNAAFDVGFLNNELGLLELESIEQLCGKPVDTLKMAREIRPGKKNNLDALCREYGVDNSGRQMHGALLDAELLAEVYLAMTRGQDSLEIDFTAMPSAAAQRGASTAPRAALKVQRASEAELAEHTAALSEIGKESKGSCLWTKLEAENEPEDAAC